jgi:hypothetical protein
MEHRLGKHCIQWHLEQLNEMHSRQTFKPRWEELAGFYFKTFEAAIKWKEEKGEGGKSPIFYNAKTRLLLTTSETRQLIDKFLGLFGFGHSD